MITSLNINANRLGHNKEWESSWVDSENIYKSYLHQDYLILRLIEVILMKYTTPVTNREKPRNIKGEGKNKSAKKNIINSPFVELQAWMSHATVARNPQLIIKAYYRDILLERWRQQWNYKARKISSYFMRKRSGRKITLLRSVALHLRRFEKIHPKAKKNRKRRKKQLLHVNPLRFKAKRILKECKIQGKQKNKRFVAPKFQKKKSRRRQKPLGMKKLFFARRISRTIVRNPFRRKYRFKQVFICINSSSSRKRNERIKYKLPNKRKYVKLTRIKQPFTLYNSKKFLEAHYKRRQKRNPSKNYSENLKRVALLGTHRKGFQVADTVNPTRMKFTKPSKFFGFAAKYKKNLYMKNYPNFQKSSVVIKLQLTIINKIKLKLHNAPVKEQRKFDFILDELHIVRILSIIELLFLRCFKKIKKRLYFFYKVPQTESAKLKSLQKKGFIPNQLKTKKKRISIRGLCLPKSVKVLRMKIRKMKKGAKRDSLLRKFRRQVKILRIIKLDYEQNKNLPQVVVFDKMSNEKRKLRNVFKNKQFLSSRKLGHFPLFIFDALIKNRLNRFFLIGKNIFRILLAGICLLPSIFTANCKKLLWFLFSFKSALLGLFNFPFFKPSLRFLSLLNLMFVKEHQFQHTQKYAFGKILHARFFFLQVLNATIVCSVRTFDKTDAINVSFFGLHERNVSARFLSNFLALKLSQYFTMQEAIRPVIFDLKRNRALEAFRFIVAGRLTRKERAAYSVKQHGNLTLGTKDVFIDYSLNHKIMRFGIVGLKVNINLNLRKVNPVNYVMRFKPSLMKKKVYA